MHLLQQASHPGPFSWWRSGVAVFLSPACPVCFLLDRWGEPASVIMKALPLARCSVMNVARGRDEEAGSFPHRGGRPARSFSACSTCKQVTWQFSSALKIGKWLPARMRSFLAEDQVRFLPFLPASSSIALPAIGLSRWYARVPGLTELVCGAGCVGF